MPKKAELSGEDQLRREQIGAAVRRLSAVQGVKPQDVARICGVSVAHQYRVENGETTPDAIYLFKLASHLKVSVDSFFESLDRTANLQQKEATSIASIKVKSKHGHAAGHDVNVNTGKKDGNGQKH